jgi:hypothetical protein
MRGVGYKRHKASKSYVYSVTYRVNYPQEP